MFLAVLLLFLREIHYLSDAHDSSSHLRSIAFWAIFFALALIIFGTFLSHQISQLPYVANLSINVL